MKKCQHIRFRWVNKYDTVECWYCDKYMTAKHYSLHIARIINKLKRQLKEVGIKS